MDVILFEPEIPPNTGNIARLCAAFQVALHLVEPLGFKLDDRHLKRAGLDYWPHVHMRVWPDWNSFAEYFSSTSAGRLIMATTKGHIRLPDFCFMADDALIFGPETRGLPPEILTLSPWLIRIPTMPMDEGGVRSLNLSTAAGIFLFTAMNSSGLLNHLP